TTTPETTTTTTTPETTTTTTTPETTTTTTPTTTTSTTAVESTTTTAPQLAPSTTASVTVTITSAPATTSSAPETTTSAPATVAAPSAAPESIVDTSTFPIIPSPVTTTTQATVPVMTSPLKVVPLTLAESILATSTTAAAYLNAILLTTIPQTKAPSVATSSSIEALLATSLESTTETKLNLASVVTTQTSPKHTPLTLFRVTGKKELPSKAAVTSPATPTTAKRDTIEKIPQRSKESEESSKKGAKFSDKLKENNLSENMYTKRPRRLDDKPTLEGVYSGCYEGKACIEDVPGCAKSQGCELLVTYTGTSDAGPGYYRFELLADLSQGHGYVAVGLSSDRIMGDDSVVECVGEENGQVGIFLSWNTKSYGNKRMLGTPCKLKSRGPLRGCNVTLQDGKIICNFYRRVVTKIYSNVFDLNHNSFFILRAFGRQTEPANVYGDKQTEQKRGKRSAPPGKKFGNLKKHDKKYSTVIAKSLRQSVDETEFGTLKLIYLRIHGVFMIIGWIAILPNVTFVARYFKETWTDVELFDRPHWLMIHVIGTCTAGIFIFLGFLSILVHSFIIKNRVEFLLEEGLHIILGSIALFLFIVQILLGYFRPTGQKARMIVNIIHFINGTVSYLLAVVIIFLAPVMETSFFSCSSYLLIITWLVWSLIWHVVINVEIMRQDHALNLKFRAFMPLPIPVRSTRDVPGQKCRLDIFAFHAAGACIVSLLLILPYLISQVGCECKQTICLL
ncbi:unnamed protein product, partial [Allacma fusca]